MVKKKPCYKCEDRAIGCHSDCDKYLNYCKWNEELKTQRANYKEERSHSWSYTRRRKKRG